MIMIHFFITMFLPASHAVSLKLPIKASKLVKLISGSSDNSPMIHSFEPQGDVAYPHVLGSDHSSQGRKYGSIIKSPSSNSHSDKIPEEIYIPHRADPNYHPYLAGENFGSQGVPVGKSEPYRKNYIVSRYGPLDEYAAAIDDRNPASVGREISRLEAPRSSYVPQFTFSNPKNGLDKINPKSYYSSRLKTHRRSNAVDTIVLEPKQLYGIKLGPDRDKAGYFTYLNNLLKNSGYRPTIVDLDRTVQNAEYDDFTKFLIEGLGIRPDLDTLQKAKWERPTDTDFLHYLDKSRWFIDL